ncbi:hypothetical protein BVC80_8883g17 [Macleaya cordata]|uniref:Retrotransposon Copia-like N-terminal domain-containing protein n=1 Tax=Macleaya cordata TaxID=56857 RepID=A0A200Q7C7_MACCD|nr:hypothetical protein BVC80_8883g17 [Macleaya cordata]
MATSSPSTTDTAPVLPPSSSSTSSSPPVPHLNSLLQYVSVKLDTENFLVWKKQMIPLLKSQKLYPYIDPTVSILSPHFLDPTTNEISPNPKYTNWEDVDQTLLTFLQVTFTPTVLAQTPTFSTSLELFQYLESSFASQITARTHQLQTQLQQIQRGSQTITEYLAKVKQIQQSNGRK